jgi:DNA-binding transcriptional ArsR family regulator
MSIKKVRKDRLKKFVDERLIIALKHPIRAHILAVLNERVASTKEIGDEIELDVSAFYKHVQVLEELGCIECVETRTVRGAKEHFFRATATLFFDDPAWRRLPATVRHDIAADLIQTISEGALGALSAGKLGAGEPEHLSCTSGVVDARGRRESIELLERTLKESIAIQRASSARLAKSGEDGVPMTTAILGFEADRRAD